MGVLHHHLVLLNRDLLFSRHDVGTVRNHRVFTRTDLGSRRQHLGVQNERLILDRRPVVVRPTALGPSQRSRDATAKRLENSRSGLGPRHRDLVHPQ